MSARLHGINNARGRATVQTLALRMVASPELSAPATLRTAAMRRHRGTGAILSRYGAALSWRDGESVFVEGDDAGQRA